MAFSAGATLIAVACLCWGIDNNLTRKVSANNAVLLATLKGIIAGVVNTGLAVAMGGQFPSWWQTMATLAVGFLGYGVSLTFFIVALRHLGTARAGAYFSVGPFFGVAIALLLWPQIPEPRFWVALALMAVGVWLHVSERHEQFTRMRRWSTPIGMFTTRTTNMSMTSPGTERSRMSIVTAMRS